MAITYPLTAPTTVGFSTVEMRAVNAAAISMSGFTFQQQVIQHAGQMWETTVTLPSHRRNNIAPWKAMLVALKGPVGTFLLGAEVCAPQVTVTSCVVSGTLGNETATVVMTGTLTAGDYIQLGAAAASRLHMVLEDQTGDGTISIWPALRATYTSVTAVTTNPKGLFRLKENLSSWSLNNLSTYGIAFEAVEVIT